MPDSIEDMADEISPEAGIPGDGELDADDIGVNLDKDGDFSIDESPISRYRRLLKAEVELAVNLTTLETTLEILHGRMDALRQEKERTIRGLERVIKDVVGDGRVNPSNDEAEVRAILERIQIAREW